MKLSWAECFDMMHALECWEIELRSIPAKDPKAKNDVHLRDQIRRVHNVKRRMTNEWRKRNREGLGAHEKIE